MAKFYLHMQPGETLGKVTKLKYIDDISDDELTIYVFEDNTKCDESYVAEMNSMEAFNGRFVMTELSDPTNKWVFKSKEFNVGKPNIKVIDGVEYEVPDPGLSIAVDGQGNKVTGDHVTVSTSDEGTAIPKTLAMAGKRTDATPPRIAKNKKVEPKENYLLSLHPELLDPTLAVKTNITDSSKDVIINIGKQTSASIDNNQMRTINNQSLMKQQILSNPNIMSPISTNVVETIKHASININIDDILNNSEFDSVNIIVDGQTQKLTVTEFVNRIKQECPAKEKVESVEVSPLEDPDYKEDILIKNMIDKSKKKVYTIGIDVDMELPPKEVYETIKNVYPEGMSQNFVTSIARRMNSLTLKESLAAGLTAYYETSVNNNNVSDE